MSQFILAIDQGTSSTRAIIFSEDGQIVGVAQLDFQQYYPNNGWVEHDADEIWQTTQTVCRQVLEKSALTATDISCIGITNQRETTVAWDKTSGEVLAPAIVWQDRRTQPLCNKLLADGLEEEIRQKTGLLIDPYFSATKMHWLLEHNPRAQALLNTGKLALGTIDSFLIWRLTGGNSFVTDVSNASRTMLFNIDSQSWDKELLDLIAIPEHCLPTVLDCNAHFGNTDPKILGASIPITGVLGDQQAATVGQGCLSPGMIKSTYGTGCFVVLNTGQQIIYSDQRLLSTIAYRINGECHYGMEGSIFNAGTTIKWLRDSLGMIEHATDAEHLAASVENTNGTYLVPAFTGLGAPHWDANARGAILGLSRNTSKAHIVRAALESVCYQTRDLLDCMRGNELPEHQVLRVDGGMASNDWLMQFLADILGATIERPAVIETTALGAAFVAGLGASIYSALSDINKVWRPDRQFKPAMTTAMRDELYNGWLQALHRVLT